MQSQLSRLNAHLVACAAAATAVIATSASASVVYSGELNVTIQANVDGLYLNVETGQYVNGPAAGVPGWDINPYGATYLSFYAATGTGYMRNPAAGTLTGRTNLPEATPIGASSFFYGSSAATIGTAAGQWAFNSSGIVGFKFLAADGLTHYGWARIAVGATLATRTLVDYAWETTPTTAINAGDEGTPPPPPCSGDFNGDLVRDGLDMAVILSGWGTASGDANGDGTTDGLDMAVILSGWGACP